MTVRHIVAVSLLALLVACNDGATDPDNPPSSLIDMITIPGGTARMGDIRGSANQPDELPVHQVNLKPFMISRHEVTQELYLQVMGKNPSYSTGSLDLPVENVTWYEVVEFCNALSALDGLTACYSGVAEKQVTCDFNANGYRLPTEAEWEYACRAGSETDYWSGSTDEDLNRVAWHAGNSEGNTHPVGGKEANGFGLYDMHGNVAEWCWDWYDPAYYATSPASDPEGPATGEEKVQRGGSYFTFTFGLRSSFRGNFLDPSLKGRDIGFRVARSML